MVEQKETKLWYESRTVWINLISLAAAIVAILAEQPWLPPEVIGILMAVSAILNVILRVRNRREKRIEPVILPKRRRRLRWWKND